MKLQIEKIVTDAGTQARAAIDEATVSDYAARMEEGDAFPPVIVFSDGSAHYLADGFHRTLAALRCGFVDIDADIRKGTREDALWFALGANRTNGQRMNRGDVRHAVEVALRAWPDRTQQAIADQVGCSQQYVGKVQSELTTSSKLTPPATRTGADGKQYPTSYRKNEPTDPDDIPGLRESDGEQQEQEGSVSDKPLPKLGPPCIGMARATTAILNLKEIQPNDLERKQAFKKVREWLNENDA